MKTIYLDIETTGLNQDDEIVEVGVVGEHGETLFQSLVKPQRIASWPDAEAVHGIGPDKVVHAPSLSEVLPNLRMLVKGKRLVIYNAAYDMRYLRGLDRTAGSVECAMLAFAEAYGEWSELRGNFRWQKLEVAAAHVGHDFGSDTAHRAIADARAARSVWLWLEERKKVED